MRDSRRAHRTLCRALNPAKENIHALESLNRYIVWGCWVAIKEITVNTIHILRAVLCADCEVISDGKGDTCVVCGSRSLLSLGRVLGGTIGEERAVRVPTNENEPRKVFTLLVNSGASSKLSPSRSRIGRRLWKVR